ncbi:CHAP domain-containing protein [Miltoncostaea marina]|uniref:CHAP domain-containing protein n=1 Tax=Miltoncostaea marina TaxID=2843215 RepID=UPI001C3CF158|nr:CHAP domain-containing protein [Miltoncostaea marina]
MTIDTATTGLAQTMARVREIQTTVGAAATPLAAPAPGPAPAAGDFAGRLASAMGPGGAAPAIAPPGASFVSASVGPVPGVGATGPGGVGQMIADIATRELGVAEQPPGSNDAPRIAEYRTATEGSGVGPWCAYFTSWVAAQAGVPIGPEGKGEGYVPTLRNWAEQTGRYIPAGSGAPQVGDLVVFDRGGDGVLDHIGVVTGVSADGGIQTVEGNSSDKVSARSYGPGGYTGLVRLTGA